MFSKCEETPDGTLVIPAWLVQRYRRQAGTKYKELSKGEKESDRYEADLMMKIMKEYGDQ
jgi:hypothetical protein